MKIMAVKLISELINLQLNVVMIGTLYTKVLYNFLSESIVAMQAVMMTYVKMFTHHFFFSQIPQNFFDLETPFVLHYVERFVGSSGKL